MDKSKWQQMLLVVNQNAQLVQPNLDGYYKKLFLKRVLVDNYIVFLIQYIGLSLTLNSQFTAPLWFFTGTACAYIFLQGYRVFPGILLGNFIAYWLAKAGFLLAMGCAGVISLQAVVLLWFSHHYKIPTLIFYRLDRYIYFILFTAALTAVASWILLLIVHLGVPTLSMSFLLWLQWWLGNLNAILIFSCALITWDAYFPDFQSMTHLKNKAVLYTLYSLLVFIIFALILSHTLATTLFFALASLLITGVISTLFGWCGAIAALFLSGVLLCLAVLLSPMKFHTPFLHVFLCVETMLMLGYVIKRQKF